MSKPFPMGWLLVALLAIYAGITGQREIVLYAFIICFFLYALGALNVYLGKAAMKKVG